MRAPNILIVAVASLSLAACSSVRTVNGVDIESRSKLCHGPVESCVLLGLAVIAAAGIGVAVVSGLTKDRKEPRFFPPPPTTARRPRLLRAPLRLQRRRPQRRHLKPLRAALLPNSPLHTTDIPQVECRPTSFREGDSS